MASPTARQPIRLAGLMQKLVRAYGGTKKQFGDAVGLNGSTVSHLLSGDRHYVLGIEPCLRIADTMHVSPTQLLRAAGKTHIAETIERLYGPEAIRSVSTVLTPGQKQIVSMLNKLDARGQRACERAILYLLSYESRVANKQPPPQRTGKRRGGRRRTATL